jgi:hypothetical protein
MGDRSSIYITSEGLTSPIHLYGHWAGEDNLSAVVNVLSMTDRLNDPMYLTAQLFYEFAIVQGGYKGSTGFGIGSVDSLSNSDDNPPIVVGLDTGMVAYRGGVYTVEEFIKEFGDPDLIEEIRKSNG